MAKVASNLSASNVNLLSNKVEGLSEIQQKIREQARISIFEILDLDKRKFTDIALTISSIKDLRDGKKPQKGSLVPDIKYDELQTRDPYKNIFEKYKDADENRKVKMYMEIAERIILEKKGVITYKDGEKIGDDTINENFARAEYDVLNKEYNQKLDFFTVKDSDGKLYIIKWSQKELAQIAEKEKQIKDQIIDTIYSQEQEKDAVIAALKKQLANDEGENSTNATVDKPQSQIKNDSEKGGLTEEKINEMIEKKLQTYLEPLHKVQDSNEENNESTENKEENRESVEEKSLYVSRHDVELSVAQCRATSDFPTGTIEIKGTSVKVEEFEFYEEMKQEYILAKGDTAKLQQLDREFAELAILCSPKGVAVEQKYQIKLTSQEIAEGGLVVSQTRLAKYGLEVDYFEYTNTIIEREYQERIETIKKIETEINELTTIITELTTKINIEKSSSVEILEIIKQKKARLLILIKRQKELLKTFRKGKKIAKEIDDDKHQNGELAFEFPDASGNLFYNECKTRKIKRKDGKKIPEIGGIDTAVDYVDDKGRILKLEPRYGSDDGEDTTLEGYRFIYTGKKQIFETIYGETRISLGKFDAGTKGELFKHYCDKNGIRRKDGKDINPNKFDEDFMNATYEKDGKELKLEFSEGGAIGGDDNTLNKYEFVYYEGKKERDDDEVGGKLYEIIQEQEALYLELEELERQLMMARTESMRIEIERKITMIQTKLTIINQKITEITNVTKRYKETITQEKYMIIKVRKKTTIFPPMPQHPFEMTAVLSDMGTDVFREKASLKVEEELKAYYKSLGRWQVGSRLALFLGRGRRRKRMIRREMNNMANTAFQTGTGYGTLNEQSQNAADRHKHELDTNMAAVNQLATVHNSQVDQLCKDYLNNVVNDAQFQQQFNTIIANDANIQNILRGQNITHIGTNVLLRLQEQKALNQLILDMDAQLAQYIATGNVVHMDNMRNYVSQYIKDYQKTPAFMANFEQFVKGDLNARNQLRQYLNHQRAVMQMQITNLRMNIDILNKGKSAYQIDNKDREQGKGSWKYKLGHFMDKHPRGTVLSGVALSVGLGFLTAGTSAVVGAAISTGVFGAYVGTTNAVKKWTHHTKEQNTHEKNMATDYRNEQAKIQAWQNQALNGHGRRKYKAKRQLALYDQTTQENIKLSNQITEYITNLSSKVGPLTADEDNFMRCNLIEGWARLKYYRQMGHNFLASEQVDSTEKDMKRLEKAITLGLQKIGKTTNDIETNMNATNQLGTNITYNVIQNDLKASYDKSLIQFKRERRNLSLKYGIGTAAASIGASLAFQYIFGNGVFSHESPAYNASKATADYYNLGKSNGLTGSIASDTSAQLAAAPNGATVTIGYGAGTDATQVIPGHLTMSDLVGYGGRIDQAKAYVNGLTGLTSADKAKFIAELNSIGVGSGTNGVLQSMRECNVLEQAAKGLSDSGKSGLVNITLTPDPALDVVGTTTHTAADRIGNAFIEISKDGVPGKKCWFFGVPLFFNTFKDRKATKDTTDQNFGRGNQQPRQPQPQQPNPNQPHNP